LKLQNKAQETQLAVVAQAKQEFREAFGALAADALRTNNSSFLEQAKTALGRFQSEAQGDLDLRKQAVENLVAPIHEKLGKFDQHVRSLEESRNTAYGELRQQVASLKDTQENLRSETGNLVKALRAPAVRGRWGEIQLRRVIEMAGMLAHCDFVEQQTVTTDDVRNGDGNASDLSRVVRIVVQEMHLLLVAQQVGEMQPGIDPIINIEDFLPSAFLVLSEFPILRHKIEKRQSESPV
jgi:DNA anti-recombination protein RmuC